MDAIAGQTLVLFASAAERMGYPREEIARRAGVGLAQLEVARSRGSWSELMRLYQAVADLGAGPAEFRKIGRLIVTQPGSNRALRLAPTFLNPASVYRVGLQWIGPRHFPLLAFRTRRKGKRRLGLEIVVPAGRPHHSGFFHSMQGCMIAATEAMGLPPAVVELKVSERTADFLVHLPADRSVWTRAALVGKLLFRAEDFIDELSDQQREVNQHYAALLRTRRNFQHVIERLPDAVLIHRGGAIVYANAVAADVLGLPTSAELVGHRVLDIVQPADHERATALFAGRSARGPAFEPLRGRRNDGRELLLEAAPTQEIEFDEREASLTLLRDVTERRRLEEQLVTADRLSSLGAVSAGVAHELNNPLAYIKLNLRALERALEALGDEELKTRARTAAAAAGHGVERATTIVRNLNSFSRPEKDSIEALDLRRVLDSAVDMLGREAISPARFVRRYAGPTPVLANRSRLEQVFLNLLLNALQSFTTADRKTNEIVLEVKPEGDRAIALVRDNGRGICSTIRSQIFDPLFTTKPVGEGTGLGLSICHGIVSAAGGSIDVESSEGAGACFRVVLPRVGHAPSAAPPLPSHPTAPQPRRRLLVIDDEPALLHALRVVLVDDHDVEAVPSGGDALELLRRDRAFDLILCDLIMSGMSGVDLYRELEHSAPELARQIVFMTGGATTEHARSFLATTTNRVLEKPFHFDQLLTYLNECLSALAPSTRAPAT